MKDKICIHIITPEGVEYNNNTTKLKVYNTEGIIELLPYHQSYIDILKRSTIFISNNNIDIPVAIIEDAILIFNNKNNECKIITEFAINISVNKTLLKQKVANIKNNLFFYQYVQKCIIKYKQLQ